MSFSIEEDVDDTIALANTAYYQIIKSTVDQGQLGDVVVDAEYIVKAAVIVLYI